MILMTALDRRYCLLLVSKLMTVFIFLFFYVFMTESSLNCYVDEMCCTNKQDLLIDKSIIQRDARKISHFRWSKSFFSSSRYYCITYSCFNLFHHIFLHLGALMIRLHDLVCSLMLFDQPLTNRLIYATVNVAQVIYEVVMWFLKAVDCTESYLG